MFRVGTERGVYTDVMLGVFVRWVRSRPIEAFLKVVECDLATLCVVASFHPVVVEHCGRLMKLGRMRELASRVSTILWFRNVHESDNAPSQILVTEVARDSAELPLRRLQQVHSLSKSTRSSLRRMTCVISQVNPAVL